MLNLSRTGVAAKTPFCVRADIGVLKELAGVPSLRCERNGVARIVFGVATVFVEGTTPVKSELFRGVFNPPI